MYASVDGEGDLGKHTDLGLGKGESRVGCYLCQGESWGKGKKRVGPRDRGFDEECSCDEGDGPDEGLGT